ncbi:MAG: serine/threonine-protein phosphatase [Deltaproteobacteria bacterium]|nr:serine/threonine-protein phosphatase [Deltaproteobacteria bacterium]
MKIKAHALSDRGLVRSTNQDSYFIDLDQNIFIVADGIAGESGGEVASHMACQIIGSSLKNAATGKEEALRAAVLQSHRKIHEKSLTDSNLAEMGTTLCVLWLHDSVMYMTHVGDSRIYFFRKPSLWQLSEDDSVETQLNKLGYSSNRSIAKSMLTKALGTSEKLSLPILKKKIMPGDMFLLCTDGLTNELSHDEIENILNQAGVDAIHHTLVKEALSKGGNDNITVLLVSYEK